MYQTNLCKKLADGINLWSFSKNWSIDTHAETACFISDDVIRNWVLWFGNGVRQ